MDYIIDLLYYAIINRAMNGTALKSRKKILNSPRKEYMTTVKDSLGMGIHLLWVLYTKSGVNRKNRVHRLKRPPLIIVHHIKKVVNV